MPCPASVRRSEGLQDTQNVYAIEGTFAHALGAHCLTTGKHPAELTGQRARDFLSEAEMHGYLTEDYGDEPWAFEYFDSLKVDEDMVKYIADYCDYVNSQVEEGDILLVEQRYDLTDLLGEEAGGTADVVIIKPARKVLVVIDLKYGKGKLVIAQGNPQMLLYTVGAFSNIVELFGIDIEAIHTVIYQPRKDHIDAATYARWDIDQFMVHAASRAIRTRASDAEAVPGPEQCDYCLAKGSCPEYAKDVYEILGGEPVTDLDFAQLAAVPIEALTPEDIGRILPKLDYIRDWCDSVLAVAVKDAEFGLPPPGYKLVAGKKGARAWTDEAVVEDLIRNSMRIPATIAYKTSLISPTQAEKALKAKQYKRLQEFIVQATGKPALVPESDKRPPLELGVAEGEFQTPNLEKEN